MSKIRFVTADDLPNFLGCLKDMGHAVLSPQEVSSDTRPAVIFAPWEKGMPINLAKASVSPKETVMPECFELFTVRNIITPDGEQPEYTVKMQSPPVTVFGCRACDARGFASFDMTFLQGLYPDPYYKARREALTVITLTCDTGCETCFCHWVGIGPTSPTGSDILMTKIENGYVLQAITSAGENLLNETSLEDGSAKFPQAEEVRKKAWASLVPAPKIMNVPEKLSQVFNDEAFWEEQTARCISCGACTYFCPTCYCFNITDEGEQQSEKGARRLRSWDNCMSSRYTREASGHNPRPKKAQRMRNRVSHKFWTFPLNWGSFLCSGCGRCITHCPVNLDIREIVLAAINHKGAQ